MIRDDATQRQVDAADPTASTWLTANAGSGKTRVLTDRVARLLLDQVSPQNILCLTYTTAAAAEMQNRLFQRLGAWAMEDDDALREQLIALGVDGSLDSRRLSGARTLFASAIETPGGLKIQTIHSFCASILRRFPLEAGISPQFQEMEDRAAVLLRTEVVDAMASGPERQIVQEMMRHFTGAEFEKLLAEIAGKRSYFAKPVDQAALLDLFDLPSNPSRDHALKIAFSGGEADLVDDIKEALKNQSKTYVEFATTLAGLNFKNPGWDDLATISKQFLYAKDGTSKSRNFPQSGHKKAVEATAPFIADLHDWMDRTEAAQSFLKSVAAFARTCALHEFAHQFLIAYADRKTAMGMLDFDDLINKAGQLLTDSQVAQWVLFRLDGGIDHILVDEAQDTSPAQWKVIENLTQELTAGTSERGGKARTIFVVGDKKQSIYSFQGADPREFDRMQALYKKALAAPGPGLQSTDLRHSFRSSPAILRTVDSTFSDDEGRQAIGWTDFHIAFNDDMPGRVDLWPVIDKSENAPAKDKDPEDRWYDPVDKIRESHHHAQMAARIADQIKRIIATETLPTPQGRRAITEGDFLILFQGRNPLFSETIRACKMSGLRVAGADRFRVGTVLAVRDIAALLNFLALPEDDLSLAATLRSPLFGWSEQDIYTLAHHRPQNGTLWEALRNSAHTKTLAVLHDLFKQADFLRPFDLIDRILLRHDGRRNLLARLGAEAEDGIDALLSQALAYESVGTPSLTGFLTWMDADDLEIKRKMDTQSDQIRVMSVHGSKGLEAPIVILPDCTVRRQDMSDDILTTDTHALWKSNGDNNPPALTALRTEKLEAQQNERLRLLYVAMTRAENWLIVGAAGDLGNDNNSWYDIVSAGMSHLGATESQAGDLAIERIEHGDWNGGELAPTKAAPSPPLAPPQFGTIPPIPRSVTFAPSDLGGEKIVPGDPAGDDVEDALALGRTLHLLLEHLPDVPAAQRPDLARKVVTAAQDVHDAQTSNALIDDAIRVLDTPALAAVFAADARAEVGITATLPELDGARIHGTIDRLIITDGQILAVDFKSNRLVPKDSSQTPEGLLRQMGAYAAALAQIYPDHVIETAILWTRTATLMRLPPQTVAAALARVTTS